MSTETQPEQNTPKERADLSSVSFDHSIEVSSDANLTGKQREFTLTIAQDEKHFHVHSEIPSITRALLQHPGFIAEDGRISANGKLTRVKGRLNMGYMKIGPSCRTASNIYAHIVNPDKPDSSAFDELNDA